MPSASAGRRSSASTTSRLMRPPNVTLSRILIEAYRPCVNFGVCREAKWDPPGGHAPRGYLGGCGPASAIELVMVFAEPGHPHIDESYDPNASPEAMMRQTLEHVWTSYAEGTDLFHRNVQIGRAHV